MTTLDTWVARPRQHPRPRIRLVCFAHAGGGASLFRTWPDGLPADVEVWAVKLPGREARLREPCLRDAVAAAAAVANAIGPALEGPYALFGHSLGAKVAFEVARALRRQYGTEPAHLFASGSESPGSPPRRTPLHHLGDEAFRDGLRRLGGTPEEILTNPELMAILMPLLRADIEMNDTYTYSAEAPLTCPVSACGGATDPNVDTALLAEWQTHTEGRFGVHVFPGDHFYLGTSAPALLRLIAHELRDAAATAAPA